MSRALVDDPRLSPFDLGKGAPVLLVHGFTGTPFEMRYLGGRLARRGFRTIGVRLPGHGTDPFALERTTAMEWINEARARLLELPAGQRVHLVGLSMGSLIAALLAADHPERVRSLALCAPALRVDPLRRVMLRFAKLRLLTPKLRFIEKGPNELHDPLMRRRLPTIGRIPVAAAEQFSLMQAWARLALPKVTAPTMVLYSERDRTVPPAAALECARRIGSRPVRMVRLERSCHILTLDVERARVADEIERFFRELT